MRDKETIIVSKRRSPLLGIFAAVLCLVLCWPALSLAQVFTVPSAFILTQTYEDPNLNDIETRILLRKDGALIDSSDINWVELRDSQGVEMIPTSGPEFKRTDFILADWNPSLGWSWHLSGYSGFVLHYPDLLPGMYTFEATSSTVGAITATAEFPGRVELTPVSSSSVYSFWNQDGSLFLSWAEPVGDSEFEQYRVVFADTAGNEIFSGRIDRGVNYVVIPPDLLEIIRGLGSTDNVYWSIRTSKRIADGMDYTRSQSNQVLLSLQQSHSVGPVTGHVLGEGRNYPPQGTLVTLQRLEGWGYESINLWYPDGTGWFYFNSDWWSNPLFPGTYQVVLTAPGYATVLVGPRVLSAGNVWDLGTVVFQSPPQASSIGGRLIDQLTGDPLQGNPEPWAGVNLIRVDESGWYEWVGGQNTNSTGEFLFTPANSGPLLAGTYYVEVNAQGYEGYRSVDFYAAAGEAVMLGDLGIEPVPIWISNVLPCDPIIPGGMCYFSFEVANRSKKRFEGAVWSLVNGNGIESYVGSTIFQTASRGTNKPLEKLSLKPMEVKKLSFEFPVPTSLPDWATFCVDAYVGGEPEVLFQTKAMNWLFCVYNAPDGMHFVPENKMRTLRQPKTGKPKVWRDLR